LKNKSPAKNNKRKKGPGFGKLKILIILGVLVYAGVTFAGQQSTLATQLKRQEELRAQEEALEREHAFVDNERDFIGTDEYTIQQARKRMGWLHPDEIKYVESEDEQGD